MTPLFVLRSQPGCDATVRTARDLGLDAHGYPLFAVRPLDWQAPPVENFDALLIGSANALRHGGSAHLGLQLGQGHVLLTVDDRGPGLPEAALEQVFQPWLRLPATGTDDDHSGPAGHGLGLAIARDLAARDGGLLSLHNRPGGGLRAQLQLPTTVSAPTHAA